MAGIMAFLPIKFNRNLRKRPVLDEKKEFFCDFFYKN